VASYLQNSNNNYNNLVDDPYGTSWKTTIQKTVAQHRDLWAAFHFRYMEIWNFSTSFNLTAARHPEYLGKETRERQIRYGENEKYDCTKKELR